MLAMNIRVLLFICSVCLVHSLSSSHVVHERCSEIALQRWHQGKRVTSDAILPVRIGLTQSNLDKGHDLLMKISDPESSLYGKYLSADEVTDFFAPKDETITAVSKWLTSSGIDYERLTLSANRQWIKFDAPAIEVEKLLHAKYHIFQHESTYEDDVATEVYSVPKVVSKHIDYIVPGVRLRSMNNAKKARRAISVESEDDVVDKMSKRSSTNRYANCTTKGFTPECIAELYNITQATTAVKGNDMGIYETDNDIYHQEDMNLFISHYYPRAPHGFAPDHIGIDNASLVYKNNPFFGDIETAIDTQVALPIIYPQGFTIWQISQPHNLSIIEYNTWLDALDGSYCNYTAFNITGDTPGFDPKYPDRRWPHKEQCGVYKPTNVISISYGEGEAAYPVNYMKRQCNEYMKLGMQGTTVLYCSQDFGVAGGDGVPDMYKYHDCLPTNHGIAFAPIFPATCPYVTAVGATTFRNGSDVLDRSREIAWPRSGGGFSNIWSAPDYQQSTVHKYLTEYPPTHPSYSTQNGKNIGAGGGVFNRNGRGFPDISALGTKLLAYQGGNLSLLGGTSMATPLWAAVITRLNEERLLENKSTLGFLNPTLYKNPSLVRDILKGSNEGCLPKTIGFNVTKGWDPVTGLGVPDFPALMEFFKSL